MSTSSSTEKIRQKLNLKIYLNELTALIGRPVYANELNSLEQTTALRETSQKFVAQEPQACEILFSERSSDRFKGFIQRLHSANPSSVYVWTPRTIVCGALLAPSIAAINFDFDFTINEEGILAFSTSDLEDRLLFDFSVSSTGDQIMRLETLGQNWARVVY
ncbi:hypothetical protein [Pseudomonas indica]|uniref:hypothetical protein n=1 Tax=Pseudomonas indica TaxID=137658 RepID=UPI0023F62A7B|nr:hypothetical protein [Pseudomonas indica]MBU3056136.1 hypothetical protein [Pseudomonas indica]